MSVIDTIYIEPAYRETLAALGFDRASLVFDDSRLRVWRDLEDRDNSTLDATLVDGRSIRLHIKRDKHKRREPMSLEAHGIQLLNAAGIDSAPLVAHGSVGDRTFVVTENLDGYLSADRLLETDADRAPVLAAMFQTAAALHEAGLHHRDLYANHFYCRPVGDGVHVRLIDTARVCRLPLLFRERWIVKDVAQLVFSLTPYFSNDDERTTALRHYERLTHRSDADRFERRVKAKATRIDRHDRALREKRPRRNLRLADGN